MPQSIVQPLRRWDPDRIGPYAIIGKLGAGAMGQVFLARSAAGRLVAVKTIRIELAEEAGFRARFAREVAAASRVSGVFTAAVIEADPDADLPWVATAYVPAPSLSTLVRTAGPLPVPALRWLAAGCAEALQSIHGAGLLHRDVKPSNVLVAPDGPRVIDFGVARAAERVQLTTTRGASGTPAYMAPEQARDATQASPASDVFSLGATLVFAATGHPPYQGETVMDILVRLATEPPDLAGVPEELTGLVGACLERVPRDRPTGAAILDRLGPFPFPDGPGHVYLPDSAMKLIAEYQRAPLLPAAGADDDAKSDDDRKSAGDAESTDSRESADGGELADSETAGSGGPAASHGTASGSDTALPGFQSLADYARDPGYAGDPSYAGDPDQILDRARQRRRAPGQPGDPDAGPAAGPGAGPDAGPDAGPETGPRPGSARRWSLPPWGWAVAVVLLLAAGTGLGLLLRGSGPQAASGLGPVTPPPSSCAAQLPSGQPSDSQPRVCISQPYGDGNTVYVLHGSGFAPGAQVTVALAGVGVSPERPVADESGMFNYAIDQGHYFFRGAIPAGTYRAMASTPGGHSVSTTFRVYPAGQAPPLPAP
jgi:serine/threonine protein kinase